MDWRILVVDDEEDVRAIITATLKSKYEVVQAHDGLDALEKLERYEPDFVLMDVMMPLMNGFDACATIRKNLKFREMPVMFLSALGSQEDIKKGYGAGANLYLTKPFDPARLMRNIDMFFQTTPPERRKRRYSIEQIHEFERQGRLPAAPGGAHFDVHSAETHSDANPIPLSPPSRTSSERQLRPVPTPPQRQTPPPPPRPEPVEDAPKSNLLPRIMVVDDDPAIIDIIRMNLEGMAETVSASDGIEAIESLVKFQPDILFLDVMLPKMSGFQLCQSLRSNRAFARIPIVICSGKSADRDVQFARRVGANDYLVKPFNTETLFAVFRRMIGEQGFSVRPKNKPYHEIMAERAAVAEAFKAEQEARQDPGPSREKGNKQIADFLRNEANRDSQDNPEDTVRKRHRRFFGFGKKDD